jgi:hypothetical protein
MFRKNRVFFIFNSSEIINDRRIIIIIEGIDCLEDKNNQNNALSFWLPK